MAVDTQNTSSIEIDLQDILSLVGIKLPQIGYPLGYPYRYEILKNSNGYKANIYYNDKLVNYFPYSSNFSYSEAEKDVKFQIEKVGFDDLTTNRPLPPADPNQFSSEPFKPLPKKIKFKPITGIVVNQITNEPLPGVKITNILLKRDITNKKGEFSIEHPDLAGTGLDLTKFSLNFKLKKYGPLSIIPYTSTGDIKSNLGIITLNPLEADLKNEILEYFKFPDPVVETYTTKDIDFDFKIQEDLNLSIDTLKGTVIPLILNLIATYGISKIKDLISKYENNPQAAIEEIKDLITCPPKIEINKSIGTKNKLVKKINNTLTIINNTTKSLSINKDLITTIDTSYQILKNLPTPSAIGGVGIPISVINGIQDTKTFLSNDISKFKTINSGTLAILILLQGTLSQVFSLLKILNQIIQYCSPDSNASQEEISTELTVLTTQQSFQTSPVVININGFELYTITETTDKPLKRRRAIARNKAGVIMLQGEWSFSSIDQILIDELVFYIQQNNLKAD
jgi:hypothetical protein